MLLIRSGGLGHAYRPLQPDKAVREVLVRPSRWEPLYMEESVGLCQPLPLGIWCTGGRVPAGGVLCQAGGGLRGAACIALAVGVQSRTKRVL